MASVFSFGTSFGCELLCFFGIFVCVQNKFLSRIKKLSHILQMRKSNRPPSEWLKLVCKDWAADNEELVDSVDVKFMHYKSYLKGMLTPQLLCRLSLPQKKESETGVPAPNPVDFWGILGIHDEFDKAYIIAQIERFSSLYNILGPVTDDMDSMFSDHLTGAVDTATAAAAGELTSTALKLESFMIDTLPYPLVAAGLSVTAGGHMLTPTTTWNLDPTAAAAGEFLPVDGMIQPIHYSHEYDFLSISRCRCCCCLRCQQFCWQAE